MTRSKLAILVTGLFAAALVVYAQEKKMEAPKPGPEVQRLAVFEGKWSCETDMKPSPFGPGGKMTSTDDCSWFDGGFQLVCKSTSKGPMGEMKGMYVLTWNPEEKKYVYFGFDSTGMSGSARGTASGKVWTWKGEDKKGGKVIHSRYTITEASPTSYTFKWETSEDGKSWSTVAEGTSTKK